MANRMFGREKMSEKQQQQQEQEQQQQQPRTPY